MDPSFLNTDLEIVTDSKPTSIISELERRTAFVQCLETEDGYLTIIETSETSPEASRTPESTVEEFVSLLGRLSPKAISELSGATRMEFNFGYECDSRSRSNEVHLSPSIVASIARLKASIGFTLYKAPEQN